MSFLLPKYPLFCWPHSFSDSLFFFQEGTLEAAVQPEDHSGGPCVHQQPKRVVTLWWAAASAQRHEQHLKQWPEE